MSKELLNGLFYVTEETLATVEHMNTMKRKPASEFRRQISIAQVGINSLIIAGFSGIGGWQERVYTVINNFDGSVYEWIYKQGK